MRFERGDLASRSFSKASRRLAVNDGGLLDESWFNSAFWIYGAARGQMLVFDAKTVYGVKAYRKYITKSYPHDIFTAGEGYRVFASRIDKGKGDPAGKSAKRRRGKAPAASLWERRIAVRAGAMVLASERLYLAGAPDVVDGKDPWAAFDGRKGGQLSAVSTRDGRELSVCSLASPPVHDGMAAADGRLYLSLRDGTVACYGVAAADSHGR